ncbi:probable bifunctional dTTP/UTP pyrophosphatase/methyltransferase protein [Dendronephthya gigantea]|uniref:probable bifunctional dTTP/UTP pyrophosphatase/methyltransferase protein n=1 Tax=Dendronephthya gigantea TaxID=151771 RepID=UPI001069380D|nr:probable bifunctional dTTP/UTP pyrophosphatase/methyltransferase protein [Dendronephthya gigantea]
MLQPILETLNKKNIILASGSPRRKEIMTALGLRFTSVPSLFEENLEKSLFSGPSEYAKETARQKALEVYHRVHKTDEPDLIVAVDTVVFLDKIIEKPKDEEDAYRIIKSLNGRTHSVHSGVTFLKPNKSESLKEPFSIRQFDEVTKVTFGSLTDEMIKTYVATKEPLDKAGGYGIQSTGLGGSFVKSISGDYFNVMGFPLHRFCVEIRAILEDSHMNDT